MCTTRTILRINTAIFTIIGVLHLLRLFLQWKAEIGGLVIPLWVSALFLILAAVLVYLNVSQLRNKKLK